jgi:hypothetical protein
LESTDLKEKKKPNMDKKRPSQGPPQQASPSPTGVTVAAYAQRDNKRADREREKANQRKAAVQVVLSVFRL